jgi:hypothetical protein
VEREELEHAPIVMSASAMTTFLEITAAQIARSEGDIASADRFVPLATDHFHHR